MEQNSESSKRNASTQVRRGKQSAKFVYFIEYQGRNFEY